MLGQSRRKRKDEDGNGEGGPEREDPKRAKKKEGEKREQSLEEVLQGRKAPAPELSALRLQSLKEDKKKKKKKNKKRKAEKDSEESSESSSSSSGSLFHLAAMPRGVEKIQRLHQDKPGLLANVTLKEVRRTSGPDYRHGNGNKQSNAASSGKGVLLTDLPGEAPRELHRSQKPERIANLGDHDRPHGKQRWAESPGCGSAEAEGDRAFHRPGPLATGKSIGVDHTRGRTESLVPSGIESSSAGTSGRNQVAEGVKLLSKGSQALASTTRRPEEGRQRRSPSRQSGERRSKRQRKREEGEAKILVSKKDGCEHLYYPPLSHALDGSTLTSANAMRLESLLNTDSIELIWEGVSA